MKWRNISRMWGSRQIILTLVVIMMLHALFLAIYFHQQRENTNFRHREMVIQKVLNAIHLYEDSPKSIRPAAVDDLSDREMKVSLAKAPFYHRQFKNINYWRLSQVLANLLPKTDFSIRIAQGQWLNIKVNMALRLHMERIFLFLFDFFVFACLLVAVLSIYRLTGPLKDFKRTAARLGVKAPESKSLLPGSQLITHVSMAMMQMQERIEQLIAHRTYLFAALSHDLRTPLTRLQLRAEKITDETLRDAFCADIHDMTVMADETLSLAQGLDSGEEGRNIDLVSFLNTIITQALESGQTVHFECPWDRAPLWAKPVALRRAIQNVLDNALRYGDRAWLVLNHSSTHWFVEVSDNGPGIAKQDLKSVMEPYFRSEKSRSRRTGGAGLGLAISQEIIRVHGGEIELSNLTAGGLRVLIKLPKYLNE